MTMTHLKNPIIWLISPHVVLATGLYLLADRYLSVSVMLGPTLAYAGFWAILGFVALYSRPVKIRFLTGLLVLTLIMPVRFIDWDTRKPFLKDLYRIQPGMTLPQVEQIMGQYRQGSGWPANPNPEAQHPGELTIPDSIIYRHTDEGWGDSDWGVVTFADERVIEVQFLPD